VELSRLEMSIRRLEQVMNAKLEVVNDLTAAMKYGANPKQVIIRCEDDEVEELEVREILVSTQMHLRNI